MCLFICINRSTEICVCFGQCLTLDFTHGLSSSMLAGHSTQTCNWLGSGWLVLMHVRAYVMSLSPCVLSHQGCVGLEMVFRRDECSLNLIHSVTLFCLWMSSYCRSVGSDMYVYPSVRLFVYSSVFCSSRSEKWLLVPHKLFFEKLILVCFYYKTRVLTFVLSLCNKWPLFTFDLRFFTFTLRFGLVTGATPI